MSSRYRVRRVLGQTCGLAALLVAVAVLLGCNSPANQPAMSDNVSESHTQSGMSAMSNQAPLDELMQLRDLPQDELRKKLQITDEHIAEDRSYGKLPGTTQWHNPAAHPGYFVFHEGRLVAIYVDDESYLSGLRPGELGLGAPDAQLRSRVGKRVPYNVYASKGVAIAAGSDTVYLVEIFSPTTLEQYQTTLYNEPSPYRK